ncbi:MAG TPA: single-stranded DNA-binding protein [bacterium]|jgi:single-strand DNA-binding protein|nr:single-stranded DNA-binding protein [bacterium]HOH85621.1 single-stranded DNA-binding protein [bacterium]HPX64244.1 single-stranded DNA-binding protein [bacterium]
MDLNKAMLIGNLTRDPEIRNTTTGQPVASFTVVTNYVWTDQTGQRQERAEFHNIVAWRRLADICRQYLHKGSKVYVEGRLQTRDWLAQDNTKRYRTELVADNLIMLDRAGSASAPFSGPAAEQTDNNEPSLESLPDNPAEEEIKIENIPF